MPSVLSTAVNSCRYQIDLTCLVSESPVDEEVKPLLLTERPEFDDVFRHISRDMRQWLLKGGSSKSGPLAEDLRGFFKHIPQDKSVSFLIC